MSECKGSDTTFLLDQSVSVEGYKPIRCSSAERRKLVRRLGNLHGEPRDLVEGAREDILATARVREVRQYTSGGMYVRNGPRAVYWFEKAAAQQDPKSMEALAECLECGKCTKQDPKRAAELRKAAAAKDGNRSA